jgi:hypothetical protein
MARARKRQPYNPALAEYQRQQEEAEAVRKKQRHATEINRQAMIALIEVDDPHEEGKKIEVLRSIRTDSLGRLHAHKQVDEAQYHAGRAFQDDFEIVQGQQQACDPSQPYVDQSFRHRGVSVTYSEALARLNRANRDLGIMGSPLANYVLIDGMSMAQIAVKNRRAGKRWEEYYGMRFRECLDTLALVYGFAMEKR